MSDLVQRVRQFLTELKRRKVYRVAATYAVVTFVTLQAARLIFPATTLQGVYDVLVVIAFVGFPIAVVLAWAFEVTPEGVRRTPEAELDERGASEGGPSLSTGYKVLVGLGLAAAAVAGGWYLTGGGGENPEISDRSVAVLPFEALGQEKPSTFTEGMHSDLQTKLSNIARLTVTSSRSVERYRGSEESTAAVAQELGVGWIVSGDVQRMGDQIQVNVRLVDPEADAQAWTDSYRRDLTAEDLFAIQTDITKEVARALEAELSPEVDERVERKPTESLDAYELYVQGRGFLDQRTGPAIRTAIEYFRRALEQDSTYARAWAALAEARIQLGGYGSASVDSLLPPALQAARRGLEIDPKLAEAHASAGLIHMYRQQGPPALLELRRALELNSGLAQAHRWLGVLLDILGRPGALEHLRQAVDRNPMTPEAHADLSGALLVRGKFKEALHQARRGKEVEPDYRLSHFMEVMALYQLGRFEEAMSAHRQRRAIPWSPSWHDAAGALVHVASGDTARARSILNRLQQGAQPYARAWIHAALGETGAALEALTAERKWTWGAPIFLRHGFPDVMRPLQDDRRYRDAVRNANRTWGLNPDGSLPDSVDVRFGSESDE